ncbi:diaminobutyrate acetyltransferase [Salinisphaera sp. G21_0]|uniref:diaminobutyrate acetyltransferase n=1 Tax=Salinisphaera sp. G21_0 TaxID=2821094 RepID=UPI001ADA9E12|nr:diaminobutyrate acetyltransferase [Salinisphaera sp. G21_0]MBO9482431.1 diaminobutyrate acetyltransferase [Salinisphaera sp. G21_0]
MNIVYRKPEKEDGMSVHRLVSECPPLDKNSLYCNLLQCTDFAGTSIIAEADNGEVIGFISGYLSPDSTDTLFIWQVALHPQYRGRGIALQMLSRLFTRYPQLQCLKTTIAPGNRASQKLFQTFFKNHGMTVETIEHFKAGVHLDSGHEDEVLYLARMEVSESAAVRASNEHHHPVEVTE